MQDIEFSAVKVGMTVRIKKQNCVVTEVKVISAKNPKQTSKVKITGENTAGKAVTITKPATRTVPAALVASAGSSSEPERKSGSDSEDDDEEDDEYRDLTFESFGADASLTEPVRCGDLRKGHFVVMKGDKPCKIVCITTAQPGKHGHTKATITGLDIFTGRKYVRCAPFRSVIN